MANLDLIDTYDLDMKHDGVSDHRLAGFFRLNEPEGNALDGEQLDMLNREGYLEAIYMVIASMSKLSDLLEIKNEQRKAAMADAEG